jgi:hypothetical protein
MVRIGRLALPANPTSALPTSSKARALFIFLIIVGLFGCFLTAVVVLQLRQQEMNLNYQANRLHGEIEKRQAKLWSQQVQIAGYTAPNAIAQTIGNSKLDLAPQGPAPVGAANWIGKTGNDAPTPE